MPKRSIALGLLSKARLMLGKICVFLRDRRCIEEKKRSFYELSENCQIPKLAVLYEMYFGHKSNGCFVEVGAYDGEYVSNTSGLGDIGWKGYCIEPVPEYYEHCRQRHVNNNNVTVSRCAIGGESGEIEIKIGGPLSTGRADLRGIFKSLDWAKDSLESGIALAEMKTLEDYLENHQVAINFELLSIDVEGYEWEVLRNFNLQKWQPQMVIIELHDQNSEYRLLWNECNNIASYFDRNSYKVIFKDFSNTIYVPKNSFPK